MSDSLGEFFRRFDEALAKWEREQSAPSLVEVVREARHKQPSGYAIVQAAVDWELAGFDQLPHQRPISEEDLCALFPSYLAELEPIRPATNQEFQQGLRWALTPLGRAGHRLSAVPTPWSTTAPSGASTASTPATGWSRRPSGAVGGCPRWPGSCSCAGSARAKPSPLALPRSGRAILWPPKAPTASRWTPKIPRRGRLLPAGWDSCGCTKAMR